jgi:phosphatidylserine decarboxylase
MRSVFCSMVRLRESWQLLAISAIAAPIAYALHPVLAALPAAFFAFTLYFFRDPDRAIPPGERSLVSPADGRILDVEDVDDPFAGKARRVSIFMSPLNVHVNRSPLDATVKSVKHTSGKKVAAYLKGDLDARERNRLELAGRVNVAVEQYAGVVARRIVCFAREGQALKRGERFGLIKFGSRVDLIAPLSVKIKVEKGQNVKAGQSVLGELDG